MDIAPFKLERFFVPYEFSARYLLGSSDCETLAIRDLLAYEPDAAEQFLDLRLGYTESQGAPDLRAEIAGLYETIAPEQVLVFAGAGEAIFTFMNAALRAGDHGIVHAPGYQSLYEVARANGCDVSLWMAREDDGWSLDLDWLRDNLRPNTRAVVVNFPHNPTGALMDAATQRALADLLAERGVLLFSDEVYRGLEHDPADQLPAACDLFEGAVSLGVMSKTYGLAGLRIGWLATRDRGLFERLVAFKDYTTICNSAPSEFLSTLALRHRETIVARNLGIIRRNLDALDAFFAAHAEVFDWQRPRAGSTAFPRLWGEASAEAFCIDLVERQGVMLLPSTCFFYGDRHFRLGYGRANLPEALAQFDAYLQSRMLL
ncbi:aminotransferase class I/II-fold pyridoxal phosphate-dependent enzyme [Aggregatilinea lenta]|uniref:aminotransferase class I/II-fold pyridoxal phosphate-dependent enzyme n=1 Tax=Aggregatilinea lenta TaxID=913108 RepID=UPI000E5BD600|nr:aminotransferase class I/II-fold pyridoxal phosphate-dependent enzyme [Aggregatilinea lenta]